MASMSSWLLATAGGGGAGGSPDARGGGAGRLGAAATGSGGFVALLASSSAIMRRIEARISSIEGSWTFAVWLIPVFPTAAFATLPVDTPDRHRRERIVARVPFIRQWDVSVAGGKSAERNDLWTQVHDREKLVLDVIVDGGSTPAWIKGQRPSGVRTPAQLSRTCW